MDLKPQMLLYVFKCICMSHMWRRASHDQIPPLSPLCTGAGRAERLDRMCLLGGQTSSSMLWQCLLFGAVRIWGERERTKFIYWTQLFHIWHWELWHHLKSLRGSSSPRHSLEQVRRELGHVCVCEREREDRQGGRERGENEKRQHWEISNFWLWVCLISLALNTNEFCVLTSRVSLQALSPPWVNSVFKWGRDPSINHLDTHGNQKNGVVQSSQNSKTMIT